MNMERMYIEAKDDTPAVRFDPMEFKFEIAGNSYPEDSAKFYNAVLEWLNAFKDQIEPSSVPQPLYFDFCLDYFNTSSAKYILEILRVLEAIRNKGVDLRIRWHYYEEDTDMLESGEDYQMSVNVPFEMVVREKEEEEEDFFF